MTNLGCCVENCVHNEDNMCCRGNIKVDGHKAHDAGETCCASFQDCGCHGATNSTHRPNAKIEVACDASNCMYNNNMMCSAGHIDVKHSGNTVHGETECATFKMN
ncbi:MAG: DUF1540 domain-containing protein [Lachnospiraceae bacterium]|nr:DUF1540 domain-containing protein [Lachnospiraceae bacterium]